MRVLTFYDGRRSTARRVQINFLSCLSEYCTFIVYGPREHEIDPVQAPLKYDKTLSLQDVVKELEPDIVLAYQSLVWKNVMEHFNRFGTLTIPIILLEVDFHDVKDKSWYAEQNFQLMMYRGWYPKEDLDTSGLQSIWLPHAASNEFYSSEKRYNKIVFAGSGRYSRSPYYRIRQNAIRMLEEPDMIDWLGNVGYERYPEILRSYVCALTDAAGTNQTAIGKTFEIMGSGTTLLSQHFVGEEILFGTEPFAYFFDIELTNLLDLADRILTEPDEAKEIAQNGLRIINKYHRYTHRAYELYQILLAVAGGTKVPQRWGC